MCGKEDTLVHFHSVQFFWVAAACANACHAARASEAAAAAKRHTPTRRAFSRQMKDADTVLDSFIFHLNNTALLAWRERSPDHHHAREHICCAATAA